LPATSDGSVVLASSAAVTGSHAAVPGRAGAAAFFDLDKTIIAGSSALAFSRPFLRQGLISRRSALRSAYAQLFLVLSGADHDTMDQLRMRLTALCKGWDVAQVNGIVAETLHEIVEPMVYAEATELIAMHHAVGDEVVVLSASGSEVVVPIAAMVGADRCVSTRMASEDGRYTGEIAYYCYGQEKATAAAAIAEERGFRLADCFAYTDSITDLPLLEAVGHPVVVNPDRGLRRVAAERGWPIREFSAPVPLRSRLRSRGSAVAVLAIGLGAALVLGGVLALGRRRPSFERSW
jgi:HAD superfamily hydrolase (TIGR01490 family)